MTPYEAQVAVDLVNLDESEIERKYNGRIQDGTTINGVVRALEQRGLLQALIRTDWRNEGKDKDGIYLIMEGDVFQVFRSERGIKFDLRQFADLRLACATWISWVFYQLDYDPADSMIK